MLHKNGAFDFRHILEEIQMSVSAKEIVSTLHSRATVHESFHEIAAEILTPERINSSDIKTYFAYDGSNNRGAHHMIKHVSFYDLTNECFLACEFHGDICVGTNEKVSAEINLITKKLDPSRPSEPKRIINGLSADAGRGRSGVGLARDLRLLDRLAPASYFFGVA